MHDIGWQRPSVCSWSLPRARIVSLSEQCSFTWGELLFPTSAQGPPLKREGNAFWNLIFVGSVKRSFMFIFLSSSLHRCVHLSCLASSPPRLSFTLQT